MVLRAELQRLCTPTKFLATIELTFYLFKGYRQMTSAVRQGHRVQCSRTQVAKILKNVDPTATEVRKAHKLVRFIWHIL